MVLHKNHYYQSKAKTLFEIGTEVVRVNNEILFKVNELKARKQNK